MGRPSLSAKRRAQIVKGLERVMASTGYERASIAAIAEEAGLASGLVHHYFESKQEILIELVRDLGTRLDRRLRHALKQAPDSPRARLEAWLDAHVALGPGADPDAVACWVAIGAEAIRQPQVREVYLQALLDERKQLEALIKDVSPEMPADRCCEAAAGLLALVQGAYLLGVAAPQAVPRGFARAATRIMLHGITIGTAPE